MSGFVFLMKRKDGVFQLGKLHDWQIKLFLRRRKKEKNQIVMCQHIDQHVDGCFENICALFSQLFCKCNDGTQNTFCGYFPCMKIVLLESIDVHKYGVSKCQSQYEFIPTSDM